VIPAIPNVGRAISMRRSADASVRDTTTKEGSFSTLSMM
jgi:hypothetical protein